MDSDLLNYEREQLKRLLNNNMEINNKMSEFDRKLLEEIKSTMNIPLNSKERLKKNHRILRWALTLEELGGFDPNIQAFDMDLVKLDLVVSGGKFRRYSFRYNPRVYPYLRDFIKENNVSLEILDMNEKIQGIENGFFTSIQKINHDTNSLYFTTHRNLDTRQYYCVRFISNQQWIHLSLEALEQIRVNDLQNYFSDYKILPIANSEVRETPAVDLNWINIEIACNAKQMQAVLNIVNKTAFPFPYIVSGGPGTGKTSVLIESVIQVLMKDPNTKILVTSLSNSICDQIAARLREFLPDNKIYRHYSMSQKHKDASKRFADRNYTNLDERHHSFEYFKNFSVFVATLTASVNFPLLVQDNFRFSYIFIEDANNCTEAHCLIPIAKYFLELLAITGQIVLFGDPKVNTTRIRSKWARDLGLGTSMITRLLQLPKYTTKQSYRYVTRLLDNYRLPLSIFNFVNNEFYNSKMISTATDTRKGRFLGWNFLPNPNFSIILHSVNRPCDENLVNDQEVQVCKFYVDTLVNSVIGGMKVDLKSIGIITPYRAQQNHLLDVFKDYKDLDIGNVERFVGDEKDVIIFSAAKSGPGRDVGFLSDSNRFNLFLTRARCLLIVICNPLTLTQDQHWNIFIEYCFKNNACTGENYDALKQHYEKSFVVNPFAVLKEKAESFRGTKRSANDSESG